MTILDVRAPSWQSRAACNGEDPRLFDLDGYGNGRTKAQVWELTAPARALCARCPVQAQCLAFMLPNHRRPSALSLVVAGRVFLAGVELTEQARDEPTGIRYVEGRPYPWRVEISVNGRSQSLGSYKTRAEAVKARKAGERKYRRKEEAA